MTPLTSATRRTLVDLRLGTKPQEPTSEATTVQSIQVPAVLAGAPSNCRSNKPLYFRIRQILSRNRQETHER